MPGKVQTTPDDVPPSQPMANGNNNGQPVVSGIYLNARICQLVQQMIGTEVRVETREGKVFSGLFTSCSPGFDVALSVVHEVTDAANDVLPHRERVQPKMIFDMSSLVSLTAVTDVDVRPQGFRTDGDISGNRANGDVGERQLERWQPDEDHADHVQLSMDGPHDGWAIENMYRRNAELGVQSTFKDDMSQYTTVAVDCGDENSDDYKRRVAEAARIARSIEENPSSKRADMLENDDVERDIVSTASADVSTFNHAASPTTLTAPPPPPLHRLPNNTLPRMASQRGAPGGRSGVPPDRRGGPRGGSRGGAYGGGGGGGGGGYQRVGPGLQNRPPPRPQHERSPGAVAAAPSQRRSADNELVIDQWTGADSGNKPRESGDVRNRGPGDESARGGVAFTRGPSRTAPYSSGTFPRPQRRDPNAGMQSKMEDLKSFQRDFSTKFTMYPNRAPPPPAAADGSASYAHAVVRQTWQQQSQQQQQQPIEGKQPVAPPRHVPVSSPVASASAPTVLSRPSSASVQRGETSPSQGAADATVRLKLAEGKLDVTPDQQQMEESEGADSSDKKFSFNINAAPFTPRSGPPQTIASPPADLVPPMMAQHVVPQPPIALMPPMHQQQQQQHAMQPTAMMAAPPQQPQLYSVATSMHVTPGSGIYAAAPPAAAGAPVAFTPISAQSSLASQNYNSAMLVNAQRLRRPPLLPSSIVQQGQMFTPGAPYTPQPSVAPQQQYLIPAYAHPNGHYAQQPQLVTFAQSPRLPAGYGVPVQQQYVLPQMQQQHSVDGSLPVAYGTPMQPMAASNGSVAGGSNGGGATSSGASQPPTPGPQPTPSPYPQSTATPQSPQYAFAGAIPGHPQTGHVMFVQQPMGGMAFGQPQFAPYGGMTPGGAHVALPASADPHAMAQHFAAGAVPTMMQTSAPMQTGAPLVRPQLAYMQSPSMFAAQMHPNAAAPVHMPAGTIPQQQHG